MLTAEHRKPLVAFFLVFAAACLIMGAGLRTQVVEVLIKAGAPPELITAVSPDMVLGESLTSAPSGQAVREVPATVRGPVTAVEDDAPGTPSPIQAAVESAVESSDIASVPSGARAAAAQTAAAAAATAADRGAGARADRSPARAALPVRLAARAVARPVARPVQRPGSNPTQAAEPVARAFSKAAKGPGKTASATHRGGKALAQRRSAARQDYARDYAVATESRAPERGATDRGASRHSWSARSDRGQPHSRSRGYESRGAHGPDRSSHDSRRSGSRHKAHRGSQRASGGGGHHYRGGKNSHKH